MFCLFWFLLSFLVFFFCIDHRKYLTLLGNVCFIIMSITYINEQDVWGLHTRNDLFYYIIFEVKVNVLTDSTGSTLITSGRKQKVWISILKIIKLFPNIWCYTYSDTNGMKRFYTEPDRNYITVIIAIIQLSCYVLMRKYSATLNIFSNDIFNVVLFDVIEIAF